jgi:nucleoid-associated protein YgaU
MFVLRQVFVWCVGVVGFALGVGAGMMLAKRDARAAPSETAAAPGPDGAPFPPATAPPAPPVVGITPTPTPGAFYAIGANDTLAEISKRAYGTTRRVRDLEASNPSVDARRMRPGSFLYVPVGAEPTPKAPKPLRRGAGARAAP